MNESGGFTLAEDQLELAKTTNVRVWELLEKLGRTGDENDELVHAAHASAYLWLHVETAVHRQRAEWLVSRVYCVLGLPEAALRHARRCSEITTQHPNLMEDFDRAYGHECLARANALAGNLEAARRYFGLAEELGQEIKNEEDRKIFHCDLESGDWHGLR